MKKSIAILAVCATALSPVLSTAAAAFTIGTADYEDPSPAGASETTKGLMRAECTRLASLHGPNTWVGTLDEMSIAGEVVADSVMVSGNRTQVGPAIGVGTPVPESVQVVGEPYRNGGSVNMFGQAEVVAAHFPNSEFDFTQMATWNSQYDFACSLVERVPTPALGLHRWTGPSNAAQNAKDICEGEQNPHEDSDRGENCEFRITIPAGFDPQERDDEFGSILQLGESGTLDGHENLGGPVPVDDEADLPGPVQVVVCISPSPTSKKTLVNGWAKKNGYNGDNCTTTWYNTGALNGPKDNINTGSNNIVTIPPAP